MSASKDPVTRAVELFVYVPIGIGRQLLDDTPGFLAAAAERGREVLDPKLTTARSTGVVAVAFGPPMIKRKVAGLLGKTADEPAPADVPETSAAAEPETPRVPAIPWSERSAPEAPLHAVSTDAYPPYRPSTPAFDAPSSAELPIPGYDTLSASQVVERLTGLAQSELDAVHAYEAANRQRRTILGKIEQLAG